MTAEVSSGDLSNISILSSQAIINKYDKSGKMLLFLDKVLNYNEKVNLVSRETKRDGLIKIASECLAPFELMPGPTGDIFDIGPGGGFPSIILLLSFPELKGVLFERTEKKARFLKQVIKELDISAEVITGDFIENVRKYRESSFNYGFMKYVKIDKDILTGIAAILKPGGRFIYYSRFNSSQTSVPKSLEIGSLSYYLDDDPRIRTITIFSSKK